MKTNFTECKNVKIPKNLKDCYKHDALTLNLWSWSEAIEKIGGFIFWFIIISGVITAILSAIAAETVTKGVYTTYTETQTTFNFMLFITSLLETALYAILEYLAYHAVALLLAALASIVMNTKITTNIALYTNIKNEPISEGSSGEQDDIFEDELSEEEKIRLEKIKAEQEKFVASSENGETWLCPECCRENSVNSTECKCGYVKK